MNYSCYISKIDTVSFDIFDTLLVRTVNNPEDVFFLVGYNMIDIIKNTPEDFVMQRTNAARKAKFSSINGEYSLDDIYANLEGYTDYERECLKTEELRIESIVLKANPQIKKLYEKYIKYGKRIIAVSDMYLPSQFLINLLYKNGYTQIEKVFVSCEEHANKSSGELFNIVKNKYGDKKYLHIGDSWKSDYILPKNCGWKSKHCSKNKTINGSISEVFSKKNIRLFSGEYPERIGYSVLGPIVFEFSKWLYNQVNKNKTNSILFFSRDGKILQESFELIYPNNSFDVTYFHISRKAINVATLWMHTDFNSLKKYI